jgi:beta-alanine degradation protein BauB
MKIQIAVITIVGACSLIAGRAYSQDPVQVAPSMFKVLLDNDQVRVLDVVMKPGEKNPMHSHPDYVSYVIKGGSVKFVDAKGEATVRTTKDGECAFHKGETHMSENTGTSETHVLNIELKH